MVDYLYNGMRVELVRMKEDLMKENFGLVLSYYESILGLKGQPLMSR